MFYRSPYQCVKCIYLICIIFLLLCALVIKIISLKSGIDESSQYLPMYCSFSCKEIPAKRFAEVRAQPSARCRVQFSVQ
jgi:hypothetical protein